MARKRLPIPPARPCKNCGEPFQPRPKYPQQVFCGHRCQFAAQRGQAFNARIARESAEKRGDMQRGRGEGRFYRKRMGRHEHRGVAEAALGRKLIAGERVFFRNGDKRDTSASNLEVRRRGALPILFVE